MNLMPSIKCVMVKWKNDLFCSCFTTGYQHIRMYDIHSNNPNAVTKYEDISKNVTAVGFNEEGTWMFSSGEDHAARIWDRR